MNRSTDAVLLPQVLMKAKQFETVFGVELTPELLRDVVGKITKERQESFLRAGLADFKYTSDLMEMPRLLSEAKNPPKPEPAPPKNNTRRTKIPTSGKAVI